MNITGCEDKAENKSAKGTWDRVWNLLWNSPWNNPYPYEPPESNTLYFSFSERPKHLDPARSYSAAEAAFIGQIYEPPLQYHYLKRPFVLEPLTAVEMPEIKFFNKQGEIQSTNLNKDEIVYTEYTIKIKPGIYYQPHPAFAKNEAGLYRYHHLSAKELKDYSVLSDFKYTGTRELVADDYVYQLKRLAEPSLNSPIFGLMSKYIVGLTELQNRLLEEKSFDQELDLRAYSLAGVEVIDKYTYRIRINGHYPQFRFWLAMPFFAPIPWEAAVFYAQPGLQKHNISLDWYPVGTGPFMMTENNPDRRIILVRNPNFRGETFPSEGTDEDRASGLLEDAGESIPFLDRVVYTLEREGIPFWNKFLQGYYDISPISADNFGTAIQLSPYGGLMLTNELRKKDMRLQTSVSAYVYGWAFNMLDPVVGGDSLRARNLRKAISLVFDIKEYIAIFMNGRGERAYGPIPTDIFGWESQRSNPDIDTSSKNIEREKNIAKAKALLKEAGIKPGLTIYVDTIISGEPDEIAQHNWLREQFDKIGLQLIVRGTQFNRFQDVVRQGSAQIFPWGWYADYPDPENFLFLFYGPNGAARFGGENTSNYNNPDYDKLFEKMRALPDGPERFQVIQQMIKILQEDTPWIWGFYPKSFALYQGWTRITKPGGMAINTLKYFKVNPALRAEQQLRWNKPKHWPLLFLLAILILMGVYLFYRYWQAQTRIRGRA